VDGNVRIAIMPIAKAYIRGDKMDKSLRGKKYFPHTADARNNLLKILPMRQKYGAEGYGLFWMVVEVLREQPDYRIPLTDQLISCLAIQFIVDTELLRKFLNDCINVYGLLNKGTIDDSGIYICCEWLNERMGYIDARSNSARISAVSRWSSNDKICERNANAMRTQCERTEKKIKDKIKDKIKETKTDIEPKEHYDLVLLTKTEYNKLVNKFGESGTKERIDSMNNYAKQIGINKFNRKYVSHYATILNWERRKNERNRKQTASNDL
jgi:hypothetical protein